MESKKNTVLGIDIELIDFQQEQFKEQDVQLFAKLKRCIEVRGQIRNVVVCVSGERYECLEGSKIIRAMREIGHKEVLCMNMGEITENEKELLRIEISRDYFLTNYVFLGKVLKKLSSSLRTEDMCGTIPFDSRQVNHLIKMTEFDWEAFSQNKQIEGQVSLFDFAEVEEKPTEQDIKYEQILADGNVLTDVGNTIIKNLNEEKQEMPDALPEPPTENPDFVPQTIPQENPDEVKTEMKTEKPAIKKPQIKVAVKKSNGFFAMLEIPADSQLQFITKFGKDTVVSEQDYNDFVSEVELYENPNQQNLF